MKVMVTGANGFIGKRLCRELELQHHIVERYDVAQGDLTRPNALDGIHGVDFVYHLAARTFVPDSWEEPHSFYHNNVMGTVTVLEYCRTHKLPLVVMSTYVYGNPQYLPVDERHPLVAQSPYHQSKLVCESLCTFYAQKYDMNIRIIRPFNVYGLGQSEAFLLPKIVQQVLSSAIAEIEVFDLSPKRDYIYIDDVIDALLLTQKPWQGLEVFNVGTGVSVNVEDVILTILKCAGSSKKYRATNIKREAEIDDCYADISNARNILGFHPRYPLADGITKWLDELHCQQTEKE